MIVCLFMNRVWTNSRWTKAQLDCQRVEFRLRVNQELLQGLGQFSVLQNQDGLLLIDVVYDSQKSRHEMITHRLCLTQADVDEIHLHDVPTRAKFRLFCKRKHYTKTGINS